jgi:hypothetical protein
MKEEFLHFIWKYKLYNQNSLLTTEGEKVEIINPGIYNTNAGPDFFDARIKIGSTLWAGNVEIHFRSSDWNKHGHQNDKSYQNTILHVVEEEDTSIDINIPTLLLKWPNWLESNYESLIKSNDWVGCASRLFHIDPFRIKFYLNGILIERLKQKIDTIGEVLSETHQDWSETFYRMLCQNFGLKENEVPFGMLARSLPQNILAKHHDSLFQIEALLFGQAGMLGEELFADEYYLNLRNEYRFLAEKYGIHPIAGYLWKFMRMHPGNFPTLRLAQMAQLIFKSHNLFSAVTEAKTLTGLQKLFELSASGYWDTHYGFNKLSPEKPKSLGKEKFNLLMINVIVPFYFLYGENRNIASLKDRAIEILEQLPPEKNSIIKRWEEVGVAAENALESQALLQLQRKYCEPRRCLDCTIGHKIISHEPL